ncbi:MAG: Stf0 family sulfotransferase, partial [Gaiellaceae bacterium]
MQLKTIRAAVAHRRLFLTPRERVAQVRQRIEAAGVSSSLIVCATPRTGSTMLANVLAATGSVGLALEHFNQHSLPPEAPIRLGDFLVERTGKMHGTRVFGLKLIWYQLDLVLTRLKALRGADRLADGQLIAAVFPEPHYLWITRDDVVAQAVSWWRAKITRVWRDDDLPVTDAVFDYAKIDQFVRLA